MRNFMLAVTVMGICAGGSVAAQNVTRQDLVSSCIAETRAPGAYALVDSGSVPAVIAADGGSQRGAANVNDCLQDKYQVQYGAGTIRATATNRRSARLSGDRCAQLLNRTQGQAAALAVGAGILGGFIGVGIHGATVTANLQECAATGRLAALNGTGERQRISLYRCRSGAGALKGGNGYCRR